MSAQLASAGHLDEVGIEPKRTRLPDADTPDVRMLGIDQEVVLLGDDPARYLENR